MLRLVVLVLVLVLLPSAPVQGTAPPRPPPTRRPASHGPVGWPGPSGQGRSAHRDVLQQCAAVTRVVRTTPAATGSANRSGPCRRHESGSLKRASHDATGGAASNARRHSPETAAVVRPGVHPAGATRAVVIAVLPVHADVTGHGGGPCTGGSRGWGPAAVDRRSRQFTARTRDSGRRR